MANRHSVLRLWKYTGELARSFRSCGEKPARTEGRLFHLLGAACVLMLISLEAWGASPVGEYIDPLIPDNILEINSDGSFYIEVFGLNVGETGDWTERGEQVSLRFSDGTTLRGEYDSTSVVFAPMPMLTIAWIRTSAPYPEVSDVVGQFAKENQDNEVIWLNPDLTYTKHERDILGQMAEETGGWELDGHVVRLFPDNTFFELELEGVYVGGSLFLSDFMSMSKWTRQSPGGNGELVTTGTIAGRVMEARSNGPIARAVLGVEPSLGIGELLSSDQGTFFLDAEEGIYRITASADEYREASAVVSVSGGRTTSVTLTLEPYPSWRRDLVVGDILYDPCALDFARNLNQLGLLDTQIGHIGIYVGEGETADPGKDAILHPLASWDSKDQVRVLRVDCPSSNPDCRERAAEWARALAESLGDSYSYQYPVLEAIRDLTFEKNPSEKETEWYCSELVWAAYYHQGVDVEAFPGNIPTGGFYNPFVPVSPAEICEDADTRQVGGHVGGEISAIDQRCGCAAKGLLRILCPVDLEIISPAGRVIGRGKNRWPGASYWIDDFDGDGSLDAEVRFPIEEGAYEILVLPWAAADPADDYTLLYEAPDASMPLVLADTVQLGDQMQVRSYWLRIQGGHAVMQSATEPVSEREEGIGSLGERLPAGETSTLPLRQIIPIPLLLAVATLVAVVVIAVRTRERH